MGRRADNWGRVIQSVPCPVCEAVKGAPCINPYGMVFDGKGHQQRRDKYYRECQKEVLEFSPCDASGEADGHS